MNMGMQAYSLTKAVAYDTRSKAIANKARQSLVDVGMMKPLPESRGSLRSGGLQSGGGGGGDGGGGGQNQNMVRALAPPGYMEGKDPTELSDEDEEDNMPSSEDENAQEFMLDGLDTRELYHGGTVSGVVVDEDLDSDEDWDTTEWGKEDVEQACVALLDEIEQADTPKRHRLATMMLVKLINKHDKVHHKPGFLQPYIAPSKIK